jgi:hypothetical protein
LFKSTTPNSLIPGVSIINPPKLKVEVEANAQELVRLSEKAELLKSQFPSRVYIAKKFLDAADFVYNDALKLSLYVK